MKESKDQFGHQASEYDTLALQIIPRYQEMLATLVKAIPFPQDKPLQVLDLGAGTGQVSLRVKTAFPHASLTCLDLSPNMLAVARERLARYGTTVTFLTSDFYNLQLEQSYDLIISSLAIHHLETGEDKKNFFQQLYEHLNPGGAFLNADVIEAPLADWQEKNMRFWKNYMLQTLPIKEVESKWVPSAAKKDHPSPLVDQLQWLNEIGFQAVDVFWKQYGLAIFGGMRTP